MARCIGSKRFIILLMFLSLTPFSFLNNLNISYASDVSNSFCSCQINLDGSRGTCGEGQFCYQPNKSVAANCFANPVGGFPLKSCGQACSCKSASDCTKISFAAKCINNHCYMPVSGILVEPLACPQQNAARSD